MKLLRTMATVFSKPTFHILHTFLLLAFTTSSSIVFAQKSVKKIKETQKAYIPNASERAMVQPLFMQNKKANIVLPRNNSAGGTAGGNITVEQTTYVNSDNHTDIFQSNEPVDLSKTFDLNEVVVEVRSRFTPERDGKIDVDFVIKVPKEIINPNWMIDLKPFLVTKDSLRYFDNVVVKGQQFALKQKLDYQAYDDFVNSIVPKEDYSKVFLDHEGIEHDIKARLEFYYAQYHEKWALHREYEDWLALEETKKAAEIASIKGQITEVKSDYMRRLLAHAAQDLAKGIDTTGLAVSYNAAFMNKSKGLRNRLNRLIQEDIKIPKRYQEVHAMPITSQGIENIYMTTKDTLDIVNNRYMRDKILENDNKRARKEEVRKEMIKFPYDTEARLDTTIFTGSDFIYYYKQRIPVLPGMNSAKICMNTEIIAIDESKFNVKRADTLTYFISSIAQLVDTTLLSKETVKQKNASMRETLNLDYRPNTWRFDPNYKNNAASLAKLVDTYSKLDNSKEFTIDSILIEVSTSLAGDWTRNYELTEQRAQDLKKYMGAYAPMGKRGASFYTAKWTGENWRLFARLVKAQSDIVHKDEILDIIANTTKPEESKKQIEDRYPEDFAIIKSEIYPQLEKVEFIFFAHRTNMTSETEVITVSPEYRKGVNLLLDRQYDEALEILSNYPDYNAAVALAALGYNGKAYEVLNKQKSTANVEYLSALVASRLGQDQVAIDHLLKAVKMDSSKMYRIDLDPDITSLVSKYKLQNRLQQSAQ